MWSLILLSFTAACQLGSSQYAPSWSSLDGRPLPEWYDRAKIGVFIHWGLFSVPSYGGGRSAAEWFWANWMERKQPWIVDFVERNYPPNFTYPDFAPSFKAELFDPYQWAQLFERAGARYVVLTSKHHEGWTNWKSSAAWNWNSVDTGPHRDLVGDLAAAVRKNTSLHFGIYYSLFEWFHPLFLKDKANNFTTQAYVQEVVMPQLHELVMEYKPEVIWSDGDWEGNSTYWNSTHFLAWLYNESPVKDVVVVNDRWGSECSCTHGGYFTCLAWKKDLMLHTHKWELYYSVMEGSWGYCRDSPLSKYRTMEDILTELVSAVSRGGNYLFNVGPTHDGRIVPIMEERLLQLGSWLAVNGEAIYNSTYWRYQNDTISPSVWYTYNADTKTVYGIALQWPTNSSEITLGAVKTSPSTRVVLLGYGEVPAWKAIGFKLYITLPHLPPSSKLKWAWTLKLTQVTPNYM